MATEDHHTKCEWSGCDSAAMPGRKLCERHCSNKPSRSKPKAKATIEAAAVLLASASKAKRKKGMEMLCELHADELIIGHALNERDSSILSMACNALDRPPPDLIRHLLTQPSALDATLTMRFVIARGNFLYAEEAIRAVYSGRRSLTLGVIEGVGGAYLRSLSALLHKYLSAALETYEDAVHLKRPAAAVTGLTSSQRHGWSRDGWAALYSAIALTRLDADFKINEVQRLLAEAERIELELPQRRFLSVDRLEDPVQRESWTKTMRDRLGRKILGTRAYLEWILFDKGVRSSAENVVQLIRDGAIEVTPDLAMTLLKKQDEDLLRRLVPEFWHFIRAEFCYWPLMNWLEVNGFLAKDAFGKGDLKTYWRARQERIDPPPWWQWR